MTKTTTTTTTTTSTTTTKLTITIVRHFEKRWVFNRTTGWWKLFLSITAFHHLDQLLVDNPAFGESVRHWSARATIIMRRNVHTLSSNENINRWLQNQLENTEPMRSGHRLTRTSCLDYWFTEFDKRPDCCHPLTTPPPSPHPLLPRFPKGLIPLRVGRPALAFVALFTFAEIIVRRHVTYTRAVHARARVVPCQPWGEEMGTWTGGPR